MKAMAPTRNNAVRFSNDRRRENSAAEELRPQASQVSLSRSAPQFKQRVIFRSVPVLRRFDVMRRRIACQIARCDGGRCVCLADLLGAGPRHLLDTGTR